MLPKWNSAVTVYEMIHLTLIRHITQRKQNYRVLKGSLHHWNVFDSQIAYCPFLFNHSEGG